LLPVDAAAVAVVSPNATLVVSVPSARLPSAGMRTTFVLVDVGRRGRRDDGEHQPDDHGEL
jgi:hypothetical protein